MERQDQRKIIHCDCDCFYASVETLDNPELAGKPLAVGGSGARSVVAACNYEARAFGIHSAMPMTKARQQCKELIVMPVRMSRYREISIQIKNIYTGYTSAIEPLSLDEAYLDVTASVQPYQGSATLLAEEIRRRIREEVGVTASAGIAPNKFLAKIASDWNKPDGQFTIAPHQVDEFTRELPVGKLFGVGPATEAKMHRLGIQNCGQIRNYEPRWLVEHFGVFGNSLYRLCRGQDERPINPVRKNLSVSVERTWEHDLREREQRDKAVQELYPLLQERIQRYEPERIGAPFVKVRFSSFKTTTLSRAGAAISPEVYTAMVEDAWERAGQPVRLIGLGVRLHQRSEQVPLLTE